MDLTDFIWCLFDKMTGLNGGNKKSCLTSRANCLAAMRNTLDSREP